MKNLTWQNPEQLFVAQELINKVKSKCCGIKVNKELNILAGLAKIDKRVSFHTARHTNATLLLYNGANITTVQKLLGHKSVKTTQVYANIMDITVVRDLEKTASSKK